MSKNVSGKYVAELNEDFFAVQAQEMKSNNLAFFKEYEELVRKFSPRVRFVVEDVFSTTKERDHSYDNPEKEFEKFLLTPSLKMRVDKNISEFALSQMEPSLMFNDHGLAQDGRRLFELNELWTILYALTVVPYLGKKYLHVELNRSTNYILHARLKDTKLEGLHFVSVHIKWKDYWSYRFYPVANWHAKTYKQYSKRENCFLYMPK